MHHGFYPTDAPPKSNQQAQEDMIEQSLGFAGVERVRRVVDVGCGIGGSSRYLVRKYGCEARGITLSPVQAARANELTQQQGLAERASFQVAGEGGRARGWVCNSLCCVACAVSKRLF